MCDDAIINTRVRVVLQLAVIIIVAVLQYDAYQTYCIFLRIVVLHAITVDQIITGKTRVCVRV